MSVVLPKGPDGAVVPFQLLECDSPGGDAETIPAEESAVRKGIASTSMENSIFGTTSFVFYLHFLRL